MGTHLNAFKEDVAKALGDVQSAVADAQAKFDKLLQELEAKLETPVAPAEPEVPEVPEESVPVRDSKGHFLKK